MRDKYLRRLSADIATRVFGQQVFKTGPTWSMGNGEIMGPLPDYSEDMRAAMRVVEEIVGRHPATSFYLRQDYEGLWHCDFSTTNQEQRWINTAHADTAPEVICLAALRSLDRERRVI